LVLRPGLPGVAATADEGLVGFQKAAQRPRRVLAQPMAQFVRYGPRRLVGDAQFPLQKLGRNAALVAAHQVGGQNHFGRSVRVRWNTVHAVTDSCRWQAAHS
jgi:hypothetical protein